MVEGVLLMLAAKVAEAIAVDFVKDKVLELGKKSPKTYEDALRDCIYETIEEFDKKRILPETATDKFPFYHSQDLMIALSRTMLFEDNPQPLSIDDFEDNQYFLPFSNEDVKNFYNLFLEKATSNDVLKEKFIEENYKRRIFTNSGKLDLVVSKLDTIIDKLETVSLKREQGKELSAKLPLLYGDKIVKREKDLLDVRNRLLNNKQVVLVNGMGGIGKTTLAQMYVTEYYNDYKHLLWVNINSEDFISDFNNTEGLGESLNVSLEGKNPEQYFNALIMALKNLPHNKNEQSLLVIDNAELNISKYKDYFPHPPSWHVLATSRENIKDFDVKELDFLNEEEAVELFKLHYKRTQISEDDIKEIVKTLEYHTLTIEILAKTAHNDGLDVQETVNTIAKNYDVEVDARHSEEKIRKITSYLSSIFDLSKLSEEELWLLHQFYFLPHQFHTIDVIDNIFSFINQNTGIKIQRLLSKLAAKGWLMSNEVSESYKLHKIIGVVVSCSKDMSFSELKFLLKSIALLLNYDESYGNPIHTFKWVPYGIYLLGEISDYECYETFELQNNLALTLQRAGNFSDAKKFSEKSTLYAEKKLGEKHPETAVSYSNLAGILADIGDYQNAKLLYEKAIVSDEQNFGIDHSVTVNRYSNLATVTKQLGHYNEAKELFEKAIIFFRKNFGEDYYRTIDLYHNLGSVLFSLGDYQSSKVLFEKTTQYCVENLGIDHPKTLMNYNYLGLTYLYLGDFESAKILLEKTMEFREISYGKNHPETAVSYSNLGLVLGYLDDFYNAELFLGRAIESNRKNYGNNHPEMVIHYWHLFQVLNRKGEKEEAKNLLIKAIDLANLKLGEGHPTTKVLKQNFQNIR